MNKTRELEELCEKLAAHDKFPWRKGLVLDNGDVLMLNDNEESVDELRELGLLLEHPTTIGWMFTDLVELWSKRGVLIAVFENSPGAWVVLRKAEAFFSTEELGRGEKIGEALGRALLATWGIEE
jgi:hypothetical protein